MAAQVLTQYFTNLQNKSDQSSPGKPQRPFGVIFTTTSLNTPFSIRHMNNQQLLKHGTRTGIFLVLLFFLSATTIAQQKNKIMENNKQIVKEGFDKWTNGTGSFFDLLTDDLQWTITGSTYLSKTYQSKKQFLDEVINPLNDRLSKLIVPKVTEIYADGDMVIVLWNGTATAKDGKLYNSSYSWNMQMKDGKIFRVVAFLDGIEFQDIMTRIPGAK